MKVFTSPDGAPQVTEPSLSPRAVGRLSVLRRVLGEMVGRAEPPEYLRSSQMAKLCGCEASLVRRDLVQVGANGRPGYGYPVRALAQRLEALFRPVAKHRVAVVGVGNLGKAIINYFQQHHQDMSVVALFDANQEKTDRVLHGIPSHRIDRFRSVSKDLGVSMAILAVPEAETQHVADIVVASGVHCILCFGSQSLDVPASVHVEHVDISAALDRLGFCVKISSSSQTAPKDEV